jgi:hypothetical protein
LIALTLIPAPILNMVESYSLSQNGITESTRQWQGIPGCGNLLRMEEALLKGQTRERNMTSFSFLPEPVAENSGSFG